MDKGLAVVKTVMNPRVYKLLEISEPDEQLRAC
jgi:hypothetical protein